MENKKYNTIWKELSKNQTTLRTLNLLKIIANAEKRLKKQGKSWSVNDQESAIISVEKKGNSLISARSVSYKKWIT